MMPRVRAQRPRRRSRLQQRFLLMRLPRPCGGVCCVDRGGILRELPSR